MTPAATTASVLSLACRILVTGLFAAACAHKLRDPRAFRRTLAAYRVLPQPAVTCVGALVIALEGGVAVALWWPGGEALAAAVGAALLVGYAVAIGVNLARGRRDLDCGCSFGRRGQPIAPALVARNALFAGACVVAARPLALSTRSSGEVAVALAMGVGLLLVHRVFETLQSNAPDVARLAAGRR